MNLTLSAAKAATEISTTDILTLVGMVFAIVLGIFGVLAAIIIPLVKTRNAVVRDIARVRMDYDLHSLSLRRIYEGVGGLRNQLLMTWTILDSVVDPVAMQREWPNLAYVRAEYEREITRVVAEIAALVEVEDGRFSALTMLANGVGDIGTLDIFDYMLKVFEGNERNRVRRYRVDLKNRLKEDGVANRPA